MERDGRINDAPILEFDPARTAIIEPGRSQHDIVMPDRCVMTFFGEVARKFREMPGTRPIATTRWETGAIEFFAMDYRGQEVGFVHVHVGAPVAAGILEFMIAYGAKKVIACGGCGVLDSSIAAGHALVPTAAVRDEGTSYHYLPASRLVELSASGIAAIKRTLHRHGVDCLECRTWTTDAPYRETVEMVRRRRAEGCLCVEMECSALAAVAAFRGIDFAQLLYGGDDLGGAVYDEREWWKRLTVRERLFMLSVEAAAET